jgi:23S rRNA-/tRNA-specific pseudouridylate synthase
MYKVPNWTEIHVELPLRIDGDHKYGTIINLEKGKISRSNIRVINKYENLSKIGIELFTSYTQQIRSQILN